MNSNTQPEHFPVIAWTHGANGAPMYVSHLPGDGGVDWGFTNRAEGSVFFGKTYDKALPLTEYHWRRFAKRERDMGNVAFCYLAPR